MPEAPRTLCQLFLDRVSRTPNAEAFRHPAREGWTSITWRETEARVRTIASGLRALGFESGACCGILSSTRVEWILADLGILCAGGATTTIYPSSTPADCAYILRDSGSTHAFAENDDQVQKLVARRNELPALGAIVTFEGHASGDGFVRTLAEVEEMGRADDVAHPGRFEEAAEAVRPESLATLIYTSGTTGEPKGVELTHESWVAEAHATEASGILPREPLQYLWLPLAHSFGKMLLAAQLHIGFPSAVDGRVDKIMENLAVVQPTFVCAPPRVFEKMQNKIVTTARAGGGVQRGIFRWAFAVGRQVSALRQGGEQPGPLLAAGYAIADRIVFRKIRALFGKRLHFFISGAAPLSREVAEFFDAAGVVILQGYGLTECCAAASCNRPGHNKLGTVGPPLPRVEVRIAEDGEVLLRGRTVMRGYHNRPDDTREALEGGWFHTGDVGSLDAEGFLTITDRKKDLIKTSGGKYVAPQELELKLKGLSPYISQVLVHGNERNYCTALVTLDEESVRSWAAREGLREATIADLSRRPEVKALVQRVVSELNRELPRFATIKKFTILPNDFTEAAGELTASQKPKRKVIESKYRPVLDSMYRESAVA